jgi:hypothetical protein
MFLRPFIKRLDPGVFFVPGLACAPLGALFGGYNAVAHAKHKCMMINVFQFGVQTVFGTIAGGVAGTVWPISVTWLCIGYGLSLHAKEE